MGLRKIIPVLLLTAFFIGLSLSVTGSRPLSAYSQKSYLILDRVWSSTGIKIIEQKRDVFRERGGEKDAELFVFGLSWGRYDGVKEEGEEDAEVTQIIFRLPIILGLSDDDFEKVEIAVDENIDGKISDSETKRVGGPGIVDTEKGTITFKESFTFYGRKNSYILRATFNKLQEGDALNINLSAEDITARKAESKTLIECSRTGGYDQYDTSYLYFTTAHAEGNVSPVLTFEEGETWKDGVSKNQGKSGENFIFLVKYTDLNGEFPKVHEIWIDINKNGTFEEQEKYEMQILDSSYRYRADPKRGVLYLVGIRLFSTNNKPLKYRFYFADEKEEAIGPAMAFVGQIQVEPLAWFKGPFVESREFVSSRIIPFPIVIYFYSEANLELADSLDKSDFSPFKLEEALIGPRWTAPQSPDVQAQLIVYFLRLPIDCELGKYTIPPIKIPYTCWFHFQGKKQKVDGEISTQAYEVEKVPILVEVELAKEVVDIGDEINLKLIIPHQKKDLKLKLEDLVAKSLAPLEVLDVKVGEEPLDKAAVITTVEFTAALYLLESLKEAQGVSFVEINSLEITYTFKGEDKSFATPKLFVVLNKLVKDPRIPFKEVSGKDRPEVFKEVYFLLVVGGFGILVALAIWGLAKVIKKILARKKTGWQKQVEDAKRDLIKKIERAEAERTKDSLGEVMIALKVFLGAKAEIDAQGAKAMTALEIQEVARKRLSIPSVYRVSLESIFENLNKIYKEKLTKEEEDLALGELREFKEFLK